MSNQPPLTDAVNAMSNHVSVLQWITGILVLAGGSIFGMFWKHQNKITEHDAQICSLQKQCSERHASLDRYQSEINKSIGQIFELIRNHGEMLAGITKTQEAILREMEKKFSR